MASDRQIEANRQNAQLSTGPRSPEGRQRVASNALKHGLTGKRIVLPNENPDEFDAFRGALWFNLDPQGALEEVLAEKIVADAWRLRRVPVLEHRRDGQKLPHYEIRQVHAASDPKEGKYQQQFDQLTPAVTHALRNSHMNSGTCRGRRKR